MGLPDLLHSKKSSSSTTEDAASSAASATNSVGSSLPQGTGPGTTGREAAVSQTTGEADGTGNKVNLGSTTSGGHLPAGTGPGTSGIPAKDTEATTNAASHSERDIDQNTSSSVSGDASAAATAASTQATTPSSTVGHHHHHGHGTRDASVPDVDAATHDQKHLQHVTHESVRHQEVEEVERQRSVDRHVHHIQHHMQPIKDTNVKDEIHHHKVVPVTQVNEQHDSTTEDAAKFNSLNTAQNQTTHQPVERTVVDLGETVNEKVHHHVHHVIQPVVELETVDRHRIHTVIPTKQTVHDAPIVHQSSTHEPISKEDFLARGGQLGSGLAHENAGVLANDGCTRSVQGVGEKLAQDLHLGGTGSTATNYDNTYSSGVDNKTHV